MQKELHSQGADTERLQDIANQLAQLDKELSFIKENATLVIEYQKDKRDLIDRIPDGNGNTTNRNVCSSRNGKR